MAAGSREHQLFVLLNASSTAWSCPAAPGLLLGMLQPQHRSILAIALSHAVPLPAETSGYRDCRHPACANISQAGRSQKGLFSSLLFFSPFNSFLAFSNQQRAAASETLAPGCSHRGPLPARLLCSIRNTDLLDIVISINICRCFRAGTCAGPGMPAGSIAYSHGLPSLQRRRQMILMDHGG